MSSSASYRLIPLVLLLTVTASSGFIPREHFTPSYSDNATEEAGEPLYLTPFIERGDLEGGRNASLIQGLNTTDHDGEHKPIPTCHSGYFTVNENYSSNLFFWFFPAIKPNGTWEDAPVVLWLQGGPGASSLFGLFSEHGPIMVSSDLNLKTRHYTWAEQFNMLYIDNPVGAGFSFTKNDSGYVNNQIEVGRDLYNALVQFFKLFPMLQKNPFYVTGESYAGKYVPAISYTIYKNNKQTNPSPELKINLMGLAIGDGLIDPVSMMNYGDLLYSIGLIDENQRDEFKERQDQILNFIDQRDFESAFHAFDALLNGDMQTVPSLFTNCTGFKYYFNYLYDVEPSDQAYYSKFLHSEGVREMIHVGNKTFNDDNKSVEQHLVKDVMQSTKQWLQTLLNNEYKVLIYSGQLDIIVGYQLTRNFLSTLKWNHSDEYRNATRVVWKVDDGDSEVAGYVKNVANFWEVLVRNAGHMVPHDQPRAAQDLIQRFILDTL